MAKIKLTIQNGHRNVTSGATGTSNRVLVDSGQMPPPVINEVDLVDKVYYAFKEIVDLEYSNSIELSYDDKDVNNGQYADYFMALHFDGSTNPAYNGGFVDDSPDDLVSDQSWAFAQKVADYYFSAMGIEFMPSHRTVNSTYYYAFNYTGANTKQFIIELGTMTNLGDMQKLTDYKKIGKLLFEGFKAHTGVQPNVTTPTTPPPTQPPTQPPTPPPTNPCEVQDKKLADIKAIVWGKGYVWQKLNAIKQILPKV